MPKWWPWRRSTPEARPVVARTPAVPPAPPWQRLAPVQRTIGLTSTAQLAGFTETLTTSQNPALLRPVQLLAAEGADHLSVLDIPPGPLHNDSPPEPAPSIPPRSKTWGPRLPSVQRAHVGTVTAIQQVQRAATEGEPPAQPDTETDTPAIPRVYAVDDGETTSTEPNSMVTATDPEERRALGVADMAVIADAAASPSPAASASERSVASEGAGPTAAPAAPVQRMPADTSPPSVRPTETVIPPVPMPARKLSPVQRVVSTSPLPALRTLGPQQVTSPEPTPSAPDTASRVRNEIPDAAPNVPPSPDVPSVQRMPVVDDRCGPAIAEGEDHAHHPRTVEPVDTEESAAAPAAPPVESRGEQHTDIAPTQSPAPSTPVVVNRTVTDFDEVHATSLVHNVSAAQPRAVDVQRLPAVETRPLHPADPVITRPAPPRFGTPAVQRKVDEASPPPAVEHAKPSPEDSPPQVSLPTVAADAGIGDTHGLVPPVNPHTQTASRELGIAQPMTVQRTAVTDRAPQPGGHGRITAAADSPVAQRSTAAGRRLVVLPPVRRDDVGEQTSAPGEHSVVYTSSRPVGLQRMFGPSSDRFEHIAPNAVGGTAAFDIPHEAPPSGAASYDAAANTITFAPPSIQRIEATPEPEAKSAPPHADAPVSPLAQAAASVAGSPAAAAPNIDELVNRLYDPLAARLRAELWQDRERAGALMDLYR